jgi:ABC-type sugar transport system substrate-binding protein
VKKYADEITSSNDEDLVDCTVVSENYNAGVDALAMIEKGKLTATASQSPDMIKKIAADTAIKRLNGVKIEKYANVPVELINKSNLVYQ